MMVRLLAVFAFFLFAWGVARADTVTLLCIGKTATSFDRDGRRGVTSESDAEMVIELRGDRLIRGEMSAHCSKTEREIRCRADTPEYEHFSVLNRYSGSMVMLETLRATTSAITRFSATCFPAQPKF